MNEIKKPVLRLPLQNELGVDCNCYGIISIFTEHGLNTYNPVQLQEFHNSSLASAKFN